MSQSGGAAGSKGPPGRAVTLGFADQAADAGQRIGDDLEHLEARGLDRPGQDQARRAGVPEPEGRVVGRLADHDAEARARPLGPGQAVADQATPDAGALQGGFDGQGPEQDHRRRADAAPARDRVADPGPRRGADRLVP